MPPPRGLGEEHKLISYLNPNTSNQPKLFSTTITHKADQRHTTEVLIINIQQESQVWVTKKGLNTQQLKGYLEPNSNLNHQMKGTGLCCGTKSIPGGPALVLKPSQGPERQSEGLLAWALSTPAVCSQVAAAFQHSGLHLQSAQWGCSALQQLPVQGTLFRHQPASSLQRGIQYGSN